MPDLHANPYSKEWVSESEMLDWIEENRPQICKVRQSECEGDVIEIDTARGTWRGKTLRNAVRSAIRQERKRDA